MAKEKAHYEELTDRQQAFVDSIAELKARDMDVSFENIEEGMTKQGFEVYAQGTVWNYKNNFESIIEERMQMMSNERSDFEGNERVKEAEDGRPILDDSWQYFHERPETEKESEEITSDISDEDIEQVFSVSMDESLAFNIIRTAESTAARRLFNKIMKEYKDGNEN